MSPATATCPEWKYENHPQHARVMALRVVEIISAISTDGTVLASTAIDTRAAHRKMFLELAPRGYEYYAGHYRGENFPCLLSCFVTIQSDPRVGVAPQKVGYRMSRLSTNIRNSIAALDREAPITTSQDLQRILAFLCRTFVNFLTIHPYVNGNGHAARMILWCIMMRYGFRPIWQIDVHPPDPPYSDLIARYRSGENAPLERYVLQWLT